MHAIITGSAIHALQFNIIESNIEPQHVTGTQSAGIRGLTPSSVDFDKTYLLDQPSVLA